MKSGNTENAEHIQKLEDEANGYESDNFKCKYNLRYLCTNKTIE